MSAPSGRRVALIPVIATAAALLVASAAPPASASPAGARTSAGTATAALAGHGFEPVPPKRLLDTRTSPTIHRLGPAATATLTVTGVAGVPATGVQSVVLNVTGIARTHSAFLTVWPAGTNRPNSSNVSLTIGRARANQVIAQVGLNGAVSIYNSSGNTDVVVDISGYFIVGSSYTGERPRRILDTRSNGGTPLPAGQRRTPTLAGVGGVPATGVTAVALNVTGITLNHSSYLTVFEQGTFTAATTSNLNLDANEVGAVLVIAPLSAIGQTGLRVGGGAMHLILDVQGWFTAGGDYTPVTPTRVLDSRVSGALPFRADTAVQIGGKAGVPTTAGAVVLSVAGVKPTLGGFLTVHPGGTPVPLTSSLNISTGKTTANMVIAQLSSTGKIAIFDSAQGAGVLIDVMGWIDTDQAP
jgi:hypothetical protein